MSDSVPAGKTLVTVLSEPHQSDFKTGDVCYIEGIGHSPDIGSYLVCVRLSDGLVDFARAYNVRAIPPSQEPKP